MFDTLVNLLGNLIGLVDALEEIRETVCIHKGQTQVRSNERSADLEI